jgi:hypothetical protein
MEATSKVDLHEGSSCQEIQPGAFQGVMNQESKQPEQSAASVEMISSYPIAVGQVEPLTKPENVVPAFLLVTEHAKSTMTTEAVAVATETRAPELEGSLVDSRLPPSQQTNTILDLVESTITVQAPSHEKEAPIAEAPMVQENSSLDFVTTQAVQSFSAESPAVAMVKSEEVKEAISSEKLEIISQRKVFCWVGR